MRRRGREARREGPPAGSGPERCAQADRRGRGTQAARAQALAELAPAEAPEPRKSMSAPPVACEEIDLLAGGRDALAPDGAKLCPVEPVLSHAPSPTAMAGGAETPDVPGRPPSPGSGAAPPQGCPSSQEEEAPPWYVRKIEHKVRFFRP